MKPIARKIFKHDVDYIKLYFDMFFFLLAGIAFFNSLWTAVIAISVIIFWCYKFKTYGKDKSYFYLDAFIDFLNQINSNMSLGVGFETAILQSASMLKADESYVSKALHTLSRDINMGVSSFEHLNSLFPIAETERYGKMMISGKKSGASPSEITGITIDKLYLKHKINHEISTIIFQKKLEQIILSLAPMLVIMMIRMSTPDYLVILDHTTIGKIIMSFAFSLILIMKIISEKLVSIKY